MSFRDSGDQGVRDFEAACGLAGGEMFAQDLEELELGSGRLVTRFGDAAHAIDALLDGFQVG